MKVLPSMLGLALSIGLLASIMHASRSLAAERNGSSLTDEDRCPLLSHPTFKEGDVVHCKCNDGLVASGGRCENKAAVEDRLQMRITAAVKGVKSTTDAIESERSALLYTTLGKHLKTIGIGAGALYLTKQPIVGAMLATEALSLSHDLGAALGEWGACTATPDLKVDCDNLNNFHRILEESATELLKVENE
jgi:hypothetical protein